jgi:SAM-dependent methyltransferase
VSLLTDGPNLKTMAITGSEYLRYGWQLINGSRIQGEIQISHERQRDIAAYLDDYREAKILDLGNGSLRPQYTILEKERRNVFGIDLVNRPTINWLGLSYKIARSIMRWKLGLSLKDGEKRLICGDVTHLPFPDETFDLVTSVAAFEHFLHVPSVLAEVARILKPSGLVYARIHLFTCPSGGHNVRVAEVPLRRLPNGVEAWDHLRKRRLPMDVPLNEWRQEQYLEAFARHFDIVNHYCAMREGEHLLTPDIENELSAYTREELTCGAYVIVAKDPYL